ncbi:MAG: ComEC/Rec2 family competence protein [Hyphomicrobiaceae bacterium]
MTPEEDADSLEVVRHRPPRPAGSRASGWLVGLLSVLGDKTQSGHEPYPHLHDNNFQALESELGSSAHSEKAMSQAGLSSKLSALLDAERAQWFLWVPVFFGIGSLIYFSLLREPDVIELAAVTVLAGLLLSLPRRLTLVKALVGAIVIVVCGFMAAKLRTEWVRAPVVSPWAGQHVITGTVVHTEVRDVGGQRLVLADLSVMGVAAQRLPARLRIQTRKVRTDILPGMRVRVRARVSPPPGPVVPEGFDFSRWAYFQQLGGLGFATKPIEVVGTYSPAGKSQSQPEVDAALSQPSMNIGSAIARLRQRINQRVRDALPGQTGAIASALITGERAGLSKETNTVYRNSGLFHILSISGLHMAIMGGAIFVTLRFLLAAIPAIALSFAIKKWAAAFAILGAFGYLTISGLTFATLRSFVMISVMFLAIILDRPALALRNVAVAALLLMIFYPESVLDAGFQMSFAAVIALIAGYEGFTTWWRRYRQRHGERHERVPGPVTKAATFLVGIVFSTLLASGAVAPIAAYHFHTSQQLAVLANLLAVPLTNFVVMPAALAAFVAMPFGCEGVVLNVMGLGIDAMTAVAQWVSGLPGAVAPIPAFAKTAFAMMVFGGLWLALMQTRWRLIGLVVVTCGVVLAPGKPRPDVLVGRDGRTIAVRQDDGRLLAITHKNKTYDLQSWLQRDGDNRPPETAIVARLVSSSRSFQSRVWQAGPAKSETEHTKATTNRSKAGHSGPAIPGRGSLRCDASGCVGEVKGTVVAVIRDVSALREACQPSSIIIAPWKLPKRCREAIKKRSQSAHNSVVIDGSALRHNGAYAIYIEPHNGSSSISQKLGSQQQRAFHAKPTLAQGAVSMRIETVAGVRGNRPWTQPGQALKGRSANRPKARRKVSRATEPTPRHRPIRDAKFGEVTNTDPAKRHLRQDAQPNNGE